MHPEGFVLDTARNHDSTDARVHHSRGDNGQNRAGLEQRASEHAGEPNSARDFCHSAQTVRPTASRPARAAADH